MVRRKAIAVGLLFLACTKPVKRAVTPPSGQPQLQATVVTLQTTLQPQNKTIRHEIVIAGGRARSMDEMDRWRLLDLQRDMVTFVDDIGKTYRTESMASLVKKRRAAMAAPPPHEAGRVEVTRTGAQRVLQNVAAAQSIIRAGAYQRELWIGVHPALPPNLFAVLYASEPLQTPFAPMMRPVDEAFIGLRGFPFLDHAELPYGNAKMVVDRSVVKIEQRSIPAAWLNVSGDYKDLTEPAAGRLPASSRPPSQRTPAAGSQSSSTIQKTP